MHKHVDVENIAPKHTLVPIRRMSTLIPLRKAARPHQHRLAGVFPRTDALQTFTNTFESDYPPYLDQRRVERPEKRVERAAMKSSIPRPSHKSHKTADHRDDTRKRKEKSKSKSASMPFGTLENQSVSTQFPMSPPPEEELRLQQAARPPYDFMHKLAAIVPIDTTKPSPRAKEVDQKSRKRQRSQSRPRSRAASPDPSPRKLVKTQEGDTSFGSSRGRQPRRDSSTEESPEHSFSQDRSVARERSTTKVKKSRESKHADETHAQKADRRKSNPEGKSRSHSQSRANAKSRASTPAPSSKRKSSASHSSRRATINTPANKYVQPPPFDSLPPVAPPSPSDDPLLLVASPRIRSRKSLASPSKDRRSLSGRQSLSRYDWSMESSDPLSRNDILFRDDEWDKSVLGLKALSRAGAAEKKERKRKSTVEEVLPAFHAETTVPPIYREEDVQMREVSYEDLAAVEQGWNEAVEEPPYQEHYAEASSREDAPRKDRRYPVGDDYVVPMNFGSSGSYRVSSPAALTSPHAVMTGTSNGSPDLQLFASPAKRKGTPSPAKAVSPSKRYTRPPSPWLRPAIPSEESFAQQEVTADYWPPLQDNASDSDDEQQVIEDVEQSVPGPRSEVEQERESVNLQPRIGASPVLESIFPRSISKEPTPQVGRSISREAIVQPVTSVPSVPSVQSVSSRAASPQSPTLSRTPSFQPPRMVSKGPEVAPARTSSALPLIVPAVILAPATPSPVKPTSSTSPQSKHFNAPSQAPSPIREFSPTLSPTHERTKSPSVRSRTQTASPVPFTRRYMSPALSPQSSAPIPPTQYSASTQHRGKAEMPDAPPEQEQSGLEQDESDDEESSGFGGGQTLSQRFASLEAKLAKEGRSFRFSEIAAIPSSDHSIRFGPSDLPDSSPQKASTIDEEEVLQETFILDEDEAMDVAPDPQPATSIPTRENTPVVQEVRERVPSPSHDQRDATSLIPHIQRASSVHEESIQVAQESYVEQDTGLQVPAPATVVVPSLGSAFPSPLMARQEMVVDEEVQAEGEPDAMVEDGPSWEDETDAEPLVQIRSMDPHAAARAAAILNMHHEYVQGTPKRRASSVAWTNASSRRHSVTPAIGAQPRSSQVFATPSRIGGEVSQLVPAPQLGDMTSLRGVSMAPSTISDVQRAPPPWTKHEWKALEQCFTDTRIEAALAAGVHEVDPEDIDLDDVLDRFVDNYAQGIRLKGEWSWDKMHRRACALISRQKEGTARGLAPSSPAASMITPIRPSAGLPHAARMVSEAPTNYSQDMAPSLAGRSKHRDMPPPAHIPIRTAQIDRSKSIYPSLPHSSKPYHIPSATPLGPTVRSATAPTSASRRMLNWMGSFLRSGSQEPANEYTNKAQREYVPCLPPISDADREALRHVPTPPPKRRERIVPPKEQVQLQHVPTPQPIRIPRQLNHKSSTGSVKDMIKSFEDLSDTSRSSVSMQPTVRYKTSNVSLSSARSIESSTEWSKERSELREMSFGSVRSLGDGRIKADASWIRE